MFQEPTTNASQMTYDALALQGRSQEYHSMARAISERIQDIRKEAVKESFAHFSNNEHRLERVAEIHGIAFINDSRASNPNAVWFALESMTRPVIWIAGGFDNGSDFSLLAPLVVTRVRALICLGSTSRRLEETFSGMLDPVYVADSMDEAVGMAYNLGRKGDTVLLSPGCPSFDRYRNYEERGDAFKDSVKRL